jgi:hypothetical protein
MPSLLLNKKSYIMNRNLITLLVCTLFFFLSCKEENFPDCTITNPQNGEVFSVDEDILVKVSADDANGIITSIHLYIDEVCFSGISDFPFHFTIPAGTLSVGNHSIKAVALNNSGNKKENSLTISVMEAYYESPDFVSFSDGKLPKGWVSNGWDVDPTFGYDDFYSLSTRTDSAIVTTTKTCNYIEFYYTYYGINELIFYVDDEQHDLSMPHSQWLKYYCDFSDGLHTFRWEYKVIHPSLRGYIDAIRFETR